VRACRVAMRLRLRCGVAQRTERRGAALKGGGRQQSMRTSTRPRRWAKAPVPAEVYKVTLFINLNHIISKCPTHVAILKYTV